MAVPVAVPPGEARLAEPGLSSARPRRPTRAAIVGSSSRTDRAAMDLEEFGERRTTLCVHSGVRLTWAYANRCWSAGCLVKAVVTTS